MAREGGVVVPPDPRSEHPRWKALDREGRTLVLGIRQAVIILLNRFSAYYGLPPVRVDKKSKRD